MSEMNAFFYDDEFLDEPEFDDLDLDDLHGVRNGGGAGVHRGAPVVPELPVRSNPPGR